VNLVVLGADFGRAMEAAFQEDLRNSKAIDREAWGRRSLFDKLRESSARQLAYFL
jgi:cardiolipin synthase